MQEAQIGTLVHNKIFILLLCHAPDYFLGHAG